MAHLIYCQREETDLSSHAGLKCVYTHGYVCVCTVGTILKLSQMPVVLIPVHFDRDVVSHVPSCQHSVVLRPFITADFMTGISAQPGKHISLEVGVIHKRRPH